MNPASPLPCQRDLFDIPREVCFLNAGSWSPLPKSAAEVCNQGFARKSRPWEMSANLQNEQCTAARETAARIINADTNDVAIIPSVGYGVATAAKAMNLPENSRVIVLEDDHSSPVLEWSSNPDNMMSVRTVSVGSDGNWTAALLAAIQEESANDLALVSVSNVHWADGGLVDIQAVRAALTRSGAMLVIDATHAVGVIDMDVTQLDPDFMIFPTYKWLLGPYGRAFLYVAKRHQNSLPLEQTMSGRQRVRAEDPVYFTDLTYLPDARRFDMGQRDFFISLDLAQHGMELMANWGHAAVSARLSGLTSRIADGLKDAALPVSVPDKTVRAPHILCVSFPTGMPDALPAALKARNVYVAPRLGRLRITPHVYNDEADCDHFVSALRDALHETCAT